jgi:hypothetical protein
MEGDEKKIEIGTNTDELEPEELQKLVDNNRELYDVGVSNIEHDTIQEIDNSNNQNSNSNINIKSKKDLMSDLEEKE